VRFAHRLIEGGVDLVHGHSSHHARPAEVYRGRLVLYGCGELLDDYEGIGGYRAFRSDLVLLWLPTLAADGALQSLRAIPLRLRRLQLTQPTDEDRAWLVAALTRLCRPFGLEVRPDGEALILS
jgi:poly-gamma-glutamate synthesis protein (capsule biosynthesis protein)